MKNNYSGPHHEWHQKIRRDFCTVFGDKLLLRDLCPNPNPDARPFGAWHLDFPHLRLDLALEPQVKRSLFQHMRMALGDNVTQHTHSKELNAQRADKLRHKINSCINPVAGTIRIDALRSLRFYNVAASFKTDDLSFIETNLSRSMGNVAITKAACRRPAVIWQHKPAISTIG